MPAPDPAERRAVIRGAIECAIGLNPTVRPRQTAPLVASVWRIVEPALAQRDRQVEAVRALHHEWTGGAPGCCAHCQDGMGNPLPWPCPTIRALDVRRPTPEPEPPQPPHTWCGASMLGYRGTPIGPCVLRAGHDGPVHQAASGAKWWPEQTLDIVDLTPPRLISTQLLDEADPPIDLGAHLPGYPQLLDEQEN